RVSSNIDKFSNKLNLIDKSNDSCWSSNNGKNQFILIKLKNFFKLKQFNLTFQGGFSGKLCQILLYKDDDFVYQQPFYPQDNNKLQSFYLQEIFEVNKIKLLFNDSTDFFGRITIYNLDLIRSD
ncbi:hypothetical protein WALSEDRAFT_19726, partial [Wallemia mellicola CBS 633.66]